MVSDLQPLPRHSVKQVRENGIQYLVDGKGDRLPSVTTILNATKPQAHREALAQWRDRVGVAEASRISGAASRRGTGTHKQIQRYLEGERTACKETIRPYWESIEPVLQEIHNVRLIEGPVFHYDLGYAGTVDCVASYQDIPCICEWKTADRPKQSIDRLYDYPLQVVAYLGAVNHSYQDYAINLAHALLVIAVPDHPAEVFWFEADMLKQLWQQWEQRVAQFWRRRRWFDRQNQ